MIFVLQKDCTESNIAALFTEESALKNCGITKAYRQQMVGILEDREC
jgi:hypothetical protein